MKKTISQVIKYKRNSRFFVFRTLVLTTLFIGLWSTHNFLKMKEAPEERYPGLRSNGQFFEKTKKDSAVEEDKKPIPINDIQQIQRLMEQINKDQIIFNEDKFGPLRNDSLIIVIQYMFGVGGSSQTFFYKVHNRPQYLKYVIQSLSKSKGIENALVIFSHDYYGEKIHRLVHSIKFCKIMQIYYPYSMQTHPHTFPGQSPNDCPRNIKRNEAIRINCTNALHPDHNGNYREAAEVQTKHHWWWKVNYVFDGLRVVKYFKGLVMFTEEDQYLVPDCISVLLMMERVRPSECPKCKILLLGDGSQNSLETINFKSAGNKVSVRQWIYGTNNVGITFNRTTWEEIRSCAETFCRYDDYNWDWSLLPVSTRCLPQPMTVMLMNAPRALHFGECGMHFHGRCNSTEVLKRVLKVITTSSPYLYPDHLQVTKLTYEMTSVPKVYQKHGWGGWGDIRDQELCLQHVINTKR